ncbi:MAG: hypothetical protein JWM87_3380 [Candidatus Eremiobacteraeota bacterium]|nr:hypothetical protein [Candidatus Eremiobacteraeota bacterium]
MFRRNGPDANRRPIAHTHVHEWISRYLEWAQDAIVASLAVVVLIVMVQALWTLARVALFEGREPRVVLPQIVLLLILVELFRTLLFYLREHRVAVGLMIEIAIVGVLRELLINPPGTALFNAAGLAMVLLVLGGLMVANRLTEPRSLAHAEESIADDDPSDAPAQVR